MEFENNEPVALWDTMEKIRSCAICPVCGSTKFDRLKAKDTIVKCIKCGKQLTIW